METTTIGPVCKCGCHKTVSVFIILFGATFLLANFGVISPMLANILWPSFIILIGIMKLFGSRCKCCAHGAKSSM